MTTRGLAGIITDPFLTVCRVPLIKGKSPRQALREKGLLEETLKKYPYKPMAKFQQTGMEPMTNDYDVSVGLQKF